MRKGLACLITQAPGGGAKLFPGLCKSCAEAPDAHAPEVDAKKRRSSPGVCVALNANNRAKAAAVFSLRSFGCEVLSEAFLAPETVSSTLTSSLLSPWPVMSPCSLGRRMAHAPGAIAVALWSLRAPDSGYLTSAPCLT